jgi:histone acetyltransferase 1
VTQKRPTWTAYFVISSQKVSSAQAASRLARDLSADTYLVAFAKDQDYSAALSQASENWTPPGEKIAAFEAKDGSYEVWQASFVHEEIRQFIKRFQILVLMFIEGGSYILNGTNDDDPTLDRWTAFFLYQKRPALSDPSQQEYHFAGFSTVYRFFPVETLTPPASPSNGEQSHQSSLDDFNFKSGDFSLFSLPCRTRISQFVILPPFQGRGLGGNLYSAIYQNYLQHAETLELTVEDPNEAFDDMRDLADLTFLRTTPEFGSLKLDKSVVLPRKGAAPRNIVDLAESEKVRRKYKIAPRQFYRVLEMDLMSKLPDAVRPGITTDANGKMAVPRGDAHLYKLWQLLVKQRLYRHNKDALIQLEHTERLEKLTETLASVEFEYMRLLALLEQRSATTPSATANGKRKVDGNGGSEESLAKRVRMANE